MVRIKGFMRRKKARKGKMNDFMRKKIGKSGKMAINTAGKIGLRLGKYRTGYGNESERGFSIELMGKETTEIKSGRRITRYRKSRSFFKKQTFFPIGTRWKNNNLGGSKKRRVKKGT